VEVGTTLCRASAGRVAGDGSSGQELLMRSPNILVGALLLGFFCSQPAVAEERLISPLDACEIVLHELIADLTRVQRTSRHDATNSRDEEPSLYNARHQATEEAFAQAIGLAKAKYARCP